MLRAICVVVLKGQGRHAEASGRLAQVGLVLAISAHFQLVLPHLSDLGGNWSYRLFGRNSLAIAGDGLV